MALDDDDDDDDDDLCHIETNNLVQKPSGEFLIW